MARTCWLGATTCAQPAASWPARSPSCQLTMVHGCGLSFLSTVGCKLRARFLPGKDVLAGSGDLRTACRILACEEPKLPADYGAPPCDSLSSARKAATCKPHVHFSDMCLPAAETCAQPAGSWPARSPRCLPTTVRALCGAACSAHAQCASASCQCCEDVLAGRGSLHTACRTLACEEPKLPADSGACLCMFLCLVRSRQLVPCRTSLVESMRVHSPLAGLLASLWPSLLALSLSRRLTRTRTRVAAGAQGAVVQPGVLLHSTSCALVELIPAECAVRVQVGQRRCQCNRWSGAARAAAACSGLCAAHRCSTSSVSSAYCVHTGAHAAAGVPGGVTQPVALCIIP